MIADMRSPYFIPAEIEKTRESSFNNIQMDANYTSTIPTYEL